MRPEDDLLELDIANVTDLLTPKWSENALRDPRREDVCSAQFEEGEWMLTVRVGEGVYIFAIRDGEPDGDTIDVAPGVKAWSNMRAYGVKKLGPGVWQLQPSLFVPGELHAFLVLCDVPEPAPFAKPLLFSAGGEAIR